MRQSVTTIPLDPHALPLPPDIVDTEWDEIDGQEALYYDAETDTYWARIGSHAECIPLEVVSVVATVSKTHPAELPSVYYDIGPAACDALADLEIIDASLGEIHVSVAYVGYEVTVHADGVICIRPPPDELPKER